MSTIQFNHRALATITFVFILYTVLRELKSQPAGYFKTILKLLLFFIVSQYLLGITAVIHAVPFVIGITHQLGALINLTLVTLILSDIYNRNYSIC
jgi:heme A synthase